MSIGRTQLKEALFQLYQQRAPSGWRRGDAAKIITEAAVRAGCELRWEPGLAEVKRLLVETVHLMEFVAGFPEQDSITEIQRPLEILFIEDSLSFARITMAALRQEQLRYNLTWLDDGAEALAFIQRKPPYEVAPDPDLILLDLRLPHVSGHELLAEIRSRADFQNIPVVVMTVSDSVEDRRLCEHWDVADYLIKPVDLKAFRMLVRQFSYLWPDHQITSVEESAGA